MTIASLFPISILLILGLSTTVAQIDEGETTADAAVPGNKAMEPVQDVPGLPRVLLIGDSISIAYTLPVRELLKGKANVHRIPVNASSSANPGRIKSWLDLYALILPVQKKYQRPFDVHFTQEGSDLMAQDIAKTIAQQFPSATATP